MAERESGQLLVITGTTGAGKDTVMREIISQRPEFIQVVTYTSRPKKPGEVEGIDYHFISQEEFETRLERGFFHEHVSYGNYYKGTPKDFLDEVVHGGYAIWRIDISRASKLKKELPAEVLKKTKIVLIGIPRLSMALDRVKKRDGVVDRDDFRKRIRTDWEHWQDRSAFDQIVMNENGEIGKVVEQILANITAPDRP